MRAENEQGKGLCAVYINNFKCWFKGLLLATLALMIVVVHAETFENTTADQMLDRLERHRVQNPQTTSQLLTQLESIIAPEDEARQQRYGRIKCWNQLSKTVALRSQAVAYSEQLLKKYAAQTVSETLVDLQLCKFKHSVSSVPLDQLIDRYSTAIEQAYGLQAPLLVAKGRSLRGALLSFQGKYSKALDDLISAQFIFVKQEQTYWQDINLGELAATYRRFGDAQMALEYQLALEQSYIKQGKVFEANDVSIHIASSYEKLAEFEKAYARYQRSETFLIENKQFVYAADISVTMAGILLAQGKHHQALARLTKAAEVIPETYSTPFSYLALYLAKAYNALANYPKSLQMLDKAQQAFTKDDNQRELSKINLLKSDIHQRAKEWKSAYLALDQYVTEHLADDESLKLERIAEMKARFDKQKVQLENTLLMRDSQVQKKQLAMLESEGSLKLIIIGLVAVILLIVSLFAFMQVAIKQRFKKMAHTDELTKLSNRRDIHQQGEKLLSQAVKEDQSFAIITFDADHFKRVNDEYGHDIGDQVLKKLADVTLATVREKDKVGRIGGEEFLILLPDCDEQAAVDIADRLLQKISQYHWYTIVPNLQQTISVGIAVRTKGVDVSLSCLITKADKALYMAKDNGRNCVQYLV